MQQTCMEHLLLSSPYCKHEAYMRLAFCRVPDINEIFRTKNNFITVVTNATVEHREYEMRAPNAGPSP